jgi:hypothetical protein
MFFDPNILTICQFLPDQEYGDFWNYVWKGRGGGRGWILWLGFSWPWASLFSPQSLSNPGG